MNNIYVGSIVALWANKSEIEFNHCIAYCKAKNIDEAFIKLHQYARELYPIDPKKVLGGNGYYGHSVSVGMNLLNESTIK